MTTDVASSPANPEWRSDLDALAFRPAGHDGVCVVHRRAFRALLGHSGTDQDCLAYFHARVAAFEAAALAKITRRHLGPMNNFHLTSRDVSVVQGRMPDPL